MQKLTKLAEKRENIFPILSDANNIDEYKEFLEEKVDSLFMDVSQRNQAEIFLKNSVFLKKGGLGALSLKTKSISQTKKESDILREERIKLEKAFDIIQVVPLKPFEKSHYLIIGRKR
jgi:fibrillarin-like pre-rRNA processing protein